MASTRWALLEAASAMVNALTESDDSTPLFSNVVITPTAINIEAYDSIGDYPVCFVADLGGQRDPNNKVLDTRNIALMVAVKSENDAIGELAAKEIHKIVDRLEDSMGSHSDFSFQVSADSDNDAIFLDSGQTITTKTVLMVTIIQRADKTLVDS